MNFVKDVKRRAQKHEIGPDRDAETAAHPHGLAGFMWCFGSAITLDDSLVGAVFGQPSCKTEKEHHATSSFHKGDAPVRIQKFQGAVRVYIDI